MLGDAAYSDVRVHDVKNARNAIIRGGECRGRDACWQVWWDVMQKVLVDKRGADLNSGLL